MKKGEHNREMLTWLIVGPSYARIDYWMKEMFRKCKEDIYHVMEHNKRIYLYDGISANLFIFVSEQDSQKAKGLHEDIEVYLDDFVRMWCLE